MGMQRQEALSIPAVRERNILRNVYMWMTAGLGLTGIVAFGIASNPAMIRALVMNPMLLFLLVIAQLGLVIYLSSAVMRMSVTAATGAFAAYSVLNGVTLSVIFLAYTGATISLAFFTTAGAFGAMSIYGFTTKRDFSGFGHYLMMGLIGIIIASVVNMFLRSPGIYYIISYIGLFVFLGLTVYDTQIIKQWNQRFGSSISEDDYMRLSIMGALKLYLDFINIFLFLLRIFGRRN